MNNENNNVVNNADNNTVVQPVSEPVTNLEQPVTSVQPEINVASVNTEPVEQSVAVGPVTPVEPVQQPVINEPVVEQSINEVPQVVEQVIPSVNVETNNVEEPTEIVEKKPIELPASEKNFKLTMTLLIIFFVLLFVYIMAMPYVNQLVEDFKNKSNSNTPSPSPTTPIVTPTTSPEPTHIEEKLSKLTCSYITNEENLYTKTVLEIFEYDKNYQIKNSSIKNSYVFVSTDDPFYDTIVNECNNSIELLNKPGYTVSCTIDDLNVSIEHQFDLENFQKIVTETETIEANAVFNQKVAEVEANLTNKGYICE